MIKNVMRGRWRPLGVVVTGATILFALIKIVAPEPDRNPADIDLLTVVGVQPVLQTITPAISAPGRIEAGEVATLRAMSAGKVVSTARHYMEGAFVRQGQLLAQIEDIDYKHKVRMAQIDVASAELALEMEQARARVAQWLDQRDTDSQATPLANRELEVEAARIRLRSATAAFDKARLDLERTSIRAPFDGWVLSRHADTGTYIDKQGMVAGFTADKPVFVEVGMSPADLSELGLSRVSLQNGAHYAVRIVSLPGEFRDGRQYAWSGKVIGLSGQLDPVSSTFLLTAELDRHSLQSLSSKSPHPPFNLAVAVTIEAAQSRQAYVLPRSALHDERFVWGIDEQSRVYKVPVYLVDSDYDYVAVGGDISDDLRIVTSVAPRLREGQQVKVIPPQDTEETSEG